MQLYRAFREGRLDEAIRAQRVLSEIWAAIRPYNQIAAVKALTALRGLPAGLPRKPILPLSEEAVERLRGRMGFLGRPAGRPLRAVRAFTAAIWL